MNSLSDRDYQSFARAIVCDFTEQNIPLRDSLVKVADTHGFNVHETRRLLEAANVQAHLTLFKAAADKKYVEFEVIDPDDVCGELFGRVAPDANAPCGEKVAAFATSDIYSDLPDEHYEDLKDDIEKVASSSVPEEEVIVRGDYEGDRGYHAYALVNKVASELENKILELHIDYKEKLAELAGEFKSVYADSFDEFEKDAYAIHGEDASHVVHSVSALLNREPQNVKVANHYVIGKPVHTKLAATIDTYKELTRCIRGYQWYEAQAAPLLMR